MEEIRSTTLGEICTGNGGTIQTGPFGSQLHRSDYREFGVPVIMPTNIRNGRIVLDGIAYIAEADAERLGRHRAKPGDIIFSRRGEVDKCAVVTEREAGWLCGTGCLLARINLGKADPNYVGYHINFDVTRLWLRQHAVGLVMPNLNTGILSRIPLTTPGLSEQRKIAAVLSAIDDKIELNRRMNETLEASARALFRDWFVDFGPTRAKAEGRPAYLAPDLWSLFPDRLGDDGLPVGWRTGVLSNIIDVSPPEPLKRGVLAPYLDMAALPTSGPNAQPAVLREYASGTRFRNGDTLLARITPCLENGKTAFVQALPENTVGWGSTEFIVLRAIWPVPECVPYLVARDDDFRRNAIQSMTGTSGRQRASADAVTGYPIALPPDDRLWRCLSPALDATFERIARNAQVSQALANTRDGLLPKLMSGELRVREAEALAA